MKFDIQKSVNTPINNISPVSGDHLRDKLQRLLSLLGGQTVDLSGKRFSLAGCPQALPFCKNLIGKMIVVSEILKYFASFTFQVSDENFLNLSLNSVDFFFD